jgi:uncharacterized protein YjiS (DUF1127 family)
MNIFQLGLTRIAGLVADYFLRWKTAELENLSDRSLKDIGLEPPRPDFDAVRPFWMP